MGFTINELRRPPDGAMYTSPERICVTADGDLCDETDPAAARLLVAKGCQIPAAEAAKYGLIGSTESPRVEPPAQEAAVPEVVERQRVQEPPKPAQTARTSRTSRTGHTAHR